MRQGSTLAITLVLVLSGMPLESAAQSPAGSDTWEIELPLEEGFRRLPPEEEDERSPREPEPDDRHEGEREPSPGEQRSIFERFADEVVDDDEDEWEREEIRRPRPEPQADPEPRYRDDRPRHADPEPSRDPERRPRSEQGEPDSEEPSESEEDIDEAEEEEAAALALARRLRPPAGSYEDLERLWEARRGALDALDGDTAQSATSKLLELREELAISSLPAMAQAVIREGHGDLRRKDAADARAAADLALRLAPDLPAAHWFRARALLAEDPLQILPVLASLGQAAGAEILGIPEGRARLVNALATLFLGLLLAFLCFLALLTVRTVRHYVHDFHHLFPKGAARIQTAVLAVAVLIAPLLLNAGLALLVLVLAAAAWFHSSWKERVLLAVTLGLVSASPFVAGGLADRAAFWGTPAEDVWRLERAGGGPLAVAALEARAEKGEASWAEQFALARHHKREGRLERALALFEEVARLAPREPAAHNNLGIVLYALDDLAGARGAFRRATELDPASARAWHNLSKAYFRTGEQAPGREARRRAVELDPDIMDRYPDQEERLNLALAENALSAGQILQLASSVEDLEREAARQIKIHLSGATPAEAAPYLPLAAVPVLTLLGFVVSRFRPARQCTKCGRSACVRCDPEVGAGLLCGQCVSVFQKKGAVSQRDRLLKEARVRRYQAWREGSARAVGFLLPGSGHVLLDRPVTGTALLAVFSCGAAAVLLLAGPLPGAAGGTWIPRFVIGGALVLIAWVLANFLLWRGEK